ncbi:hypothetical protein EX30DRAFT_21810 [Ascodesmis nigricans]|uniref:Uncharacterized protein n=1 Tax=Ascodesmis nigricans TaxID=341454 RepID=A0A4S2N7S2_9PEZI|nr:hypothetical protein EX30DRAFT_21810 [Ascodesmis nigricans]
MLGCHVFFSALSAIAFSSLIFFSTFELGRGKHLHPQPGTAQYPLSSSFSSPLSSPFSLPSSFPHTSIFSSSPKNHSLTHPSQPPCPQSAHTDHRLPFPSTPQIIHPSAHHPPPRPPTALPQLPQLRSTAASTFVWTSLRMVAPTVWSESWERRVR